MKYSEKNLRRYVEKCFKDSFKAQEREYNDKLWSFEWVMIKNSSGKYQLYPIMWCKFDKVLHCVRFRLKNNLMKNFGIQYGNTEEIRCSFYDDGRIDFNFTQAMFKTKQGNVSFSICNEKANLYENTYEKLLLQYWGLDADSYNALSENDRRRHLPDYMHKDWEAFRDLYNKTFDMPIGNYDIVCSSGIQRI